MPRERTNPFYLLLVIAGVAFVITACAYGVMALKAISPNRSDEGHPLLEFLDKHGVELMGAELAALAATSFLAMGTDKYWSGGTGTNGAGPAGSNEDPNPPRDL